VPDAAKSARNAVLVFDFKESVEKNSVLPWLSSRYCTNPLGDAPYTVNAALFDAAFRKGAMEGYE